MKKLFFTLCTSLFLLFFVWVIMFAFQVDDWSNIGSYHLDLYSMCYRFSHNSDINQDFLSLFRDMINTLRNFNSGNWVKTLLENTGTIYSNSIGWEIATGAINLLINPIYLLANVAITLGYCIALVLQFLAIVSNIASAIFDFIFVPIWITY